MSRPERRGFSLTEVLVALAVIALLAGILLPVILKAQSTARRTRAAADLQAISTALDAFKAQVGNYPECGINDGWKVLGSSLLKPVQARPGVASSKSYGPYLNTDKFKLLPGGGIADMWSDRDTGTEKPILYFAARTGKPNIHPLVPPPLPLPPPGYLPAIPADPAVAGQSLYNVLHNIKPAPGPMSVLMHINETTTDLAEKRVHVALGDVNFDGYIDGAEKAVDLPYILWSAGPDRIYGPIDATPTADKWTECDDVTNFR